MHRRLLPAIVCLIALPPAAHAQSAPATYLSVAGGINKLQRENEDAQLSAPAATEERDKALTSVGPVVSGAFGWNVPHGVRIGIEGQYRSNGITGDTDLGGQNLGSAAERKYGVMGNVLYEFGGARVTPYVGGGAGAQIVHEPGAVGSSGGIEVSLTDDTKTSFAYQVIAGAAFPIRHNLSITADYRFLNLAGTRTYTGTATVPGLGTFDVTDKSTHDENHSLVVGLRLGFGG